VRGQAICWKDEEKEEEGENGEAFDGTGNNAVIPGKYCKLIQSSYQIPTCSYISSDKDADSKRGESVHADDVISYRIAPVDRE
jgi:hypothetical protein